MKTMIRSIKPADILVTDRQRKTFPENEAAVLRQSILDNGLFHAPGLMSEANPTLVYGHRRILALTAILDSDLTFQYNGKTYDEIPYVALGELSPLQLKEIELAENLSRLDLGWQEKARAVSELEALRNAQREEVAAYLDADPQPVTLAELAEETKRSTGSISNDLAIARHLSDPDVMKAKSAKEAKKIVEKKAKERIAAERAEDFNPNTSLHTFIQGDSREVIKTLPANVYNCIVTDPPYGIDMHKDQSWDGSWHEYDDTEAYCFNLIASLLPEWTRVTQDEAHLYVFCDWSKFKAIKEIIEADGTWAVMLYPFIWNKGNVASYPCPDHWPRKSFECILYAIKGDKKHNKLDLAVIDIPQTQHHDHPAGKPASLYAHLIKRSCLAGDRVLDCFAGEGTIFEAAKDANVVATGIELSDKYAVLAKNKLTSIGE